VFIKTDYNAGFGGFDKCFCVVTDGAQAMVGHHIGLSGLPKEKKKKVKCLTLHCSINQESLCGQVIK
jgi:hypothetical protein